MNGVRLGHMRSGNVCPGEVRFDNARLNSIRSHDGFTLAELLVVVAIIAVLIAIAIPLFNAQLEKSRESTDLANVRAAYAEVMTSCIESGKGASQTVRLVQEQDGWQSFDAVTIGGITHKVGDPDTKHWKGDPEAKGVCEVSYAPETGIVFDWRAYSFNINEDFFDALNKSGALVRLENNGNFEFDSKCPNSEYLPKIEQAIASNSLLKHGTYAFLGSGKIESKRYLFWTSVDVNKVGVGAEIPVIIQTTGGKYYLSKSTTAQRSGGYVAIADHTYNYNQFLSSGTKYDSLQEAFDAYKQTVRNDYPDFSESLKDIKGTK